MPEERPFFRAVFYWMSDWGFGGVLQIFSPSPQPSPPGGEGERDPIAVLFKI